MSMPCRFCPSYNTFHMLDVLGDGGEASIELWLCKECGRVSMHAKSMR